ncbi:MAG: hypothetical protein FWD49_06635 [Firmicutes bacterium]|nr:hypothetical protein [Bacillota bacterium]
MANIINSNAQTINLASDVPATLVAIKVALGDMGMRKKKSEEERKSETEKVNNRTKEFEAKLSQAREADNNAKTALQISNLNVKGIGLDSYEECFLESFKNQSLWFSVPSVSNEDIAKAFSILQTKAPNSQAMQVFNLKFKGITPSLQTPQAEQTLGAQKAVATAQLAKIESDANALSASVTAEFKALASKVAPIIHESDFESLDYLIYLFITNRCGDMQKALQLLDEEKRNERLVKAVKSASEYVANHIGGVIEDMGSRLSTAIRNVGCNIYEASRMAENNTSKMIWHISMGRAGSP